MQDVTGRHESVIFYHYRDMTSRDRTTEESIFYELLIFWMYVIDLGVSHFMFLSHVIKPDP